MLDFRVVMVEPAFEESIGFVARAMKNFGMSTLHLVNPAAALGNEGRMRGGHAQEILDSISVHGSLPAALYGADLAIGTTAQRGHSSTNLLRQPLTPKALAESLVGVSGCVVIVLGREGTGLSNHELSLCDAIVTIPAADSYGTLNISHAAAIIFYELYQASILASPEELATEGVNSTILRYMARSLSKVGVEDYKVGLTIRALRNVLGRSVVRRREGSLLAGAMHNISNKLPGPEAAEDSIPTVLSRLQLEE